MGQAKLRGSFEERKKRAIQVEKDIEIEKKRLEQEKFNSLTQEEKDNIIKQRKNNKRALDMLVIGAMAASTIIK